MLLTVNNNQVRRSFGSLTLAQDDGIFAPERNPDTMKKYLLLLLCLFLLALPVSAEEISDVSADISGEETAIPSVVCGDNLVWHIDGGTLILSGTGEMADCTGGAPWIYYKEQIEAVVLKDGITAVGAGAFENYDRLKSVDFGSTLTWIGQKAFFGCDGLTELKLPATFKIFGEECLSGCSNLTKIYCEGGFPSFKFNCLWNSYLQIIYPAERPWPVSLVEDLEGAFQGRIEFLASDGTDPYAPTEPEETETVPETTEPETTEPETQPTTEAPTEAPTEATTAATEPSAETTEPEIPEETVPETTPPAPKENTSFGKWVLGLCIFTGVLSLVLVAVLILRRREYDADYDD